MSTCSADVRSNGHPAKITGMKSVLLILMAAILFPTAATARNPEPLRLRKKKIQLPANPRARVVLVHGFFENGGDFKRLKRRLEKQGVLCTVPRLRPSDGRGGLERLAEILKQDIDSAFGPDQPFSIVAFSMGGLVSRYYLQNLGGAARCEKLFTVSTPHHGTRTARLYPSKGAKQMRRGSRFLADLKKSESNLGKIPVVSYRTPMDLIILPTSSSIWDRAVNLKYHIALHPMMLSSQSVLTDLERRLLEQPDPQP